MLETLVSLLVQGLSRDQCAAAMGLRTHQVSGAILTHNLPTRPSINLTTAVFREIVDAVALARNLPSADIIGRRRFKPLVHARQEVMFRLREDGYAWPQIAKHWGMDHTTVMWGVAQHQKRLREQAAGDRKAWSEVGAIAA